MIIFDKTYDGESIIDAPEDIGDMLDPTMNPACKDIPQDEHGIHKGSLRVTVEWIKE